ncbi:MAG: BsuPI-related putative proteinase inhibitor [Actinomycetota bacterium]
MRRALAISFAILFMSIGCRATVETGIPKETRTTNSSYHKSVFINDMRLEIATIKKEFPNSEIVPIRLSVTNTGSAGQTLSFASGQKYDFLVAEKSGAEVWRWSAGQMFTQEIRIMQIKPGETYNYFGRVPAGYLKAGEYTVSGWLTADELLGEKLSLVISIE